MNKTLFSLQTAKPLLLASAVALALTACGGSGGSNAPTPDQPSKPIAPESGKKPESNAKPQAQQPKDNGGNAGSNTTPKKPDSKSNQPKPNQPDSNQPKPNQPDSNQPKPNQPDSNQPKPNQPDSNQPKPNQPDPNSAWTNPPELTDLKNPVGAGMVTYSQFIGLPKDGGKHHEDLLENVFVGNVDNFEVKKNSIALSQILAEKIHTVLGQGEVELKFPASEQIEELRKNGIGIAYRAKKFGYQQAQAFHYYGLIGDKTPFGVAYSMGKLTPQQKVQELQGNIVYRGPASFLEKGVKSENGNDAIAPVLERGSAIVTLNTAEKTLDAVITLPQRFNNKSYSFDQIGYKDAASFKQESQDKAISGYFYGEQAQHIGGAYYVPEGAGAFISEKQP